MGIPQAIFLAWIGAEIGYACARHGRAKSGAYDAPSSVTAYLIILAIVWAGGFFQ